MKRLLFDENGSILTEYGILVVIIAIGLIGILGFFQEALVDQIQGIIDAIKGTS